MFEDTFRDLLDHFGSDYVRHRTGDPDTNVFGLINGDKSAAFIGFLPGTDIIPGDVLENAAGDTFPVSEVKTDVIGNKPVQLKAFYRTERDDGAGRQNAGTVYNIQNAYGSVIGSGNQAVIHYNAALDSLKKQVEADTSADKEDLKKIVSLLEMIVQDQVPPSKGLFSRFSAVMERNSWLTSSVLSSLLSWLLTPR